MASAPIRQPRGPPSSAGPYPGASAAAGVGAGHASSGPPMADSESLLRRNKTVATAARAAQAATRSADSAGASATSSAADAAAYRRSLGPTTLEAYQRQLRSGSFSGVAPSPQLAAVGSSGDSGLVRRTSGRGDYASRGGETTEETLIEAEGLDDVPSTEPGNWYKGLARQSSLPSRRLNGVNPGLFTPAEPREQALPPNTTSSMPPPPPRPPRRVYQPATDQASTPPPTAASTQSTHSRSSSSHAPSHSLGSLNMLVNPNVEPSTVSPGPSTPGSAGHGSYNEAAAAALPAGVSRTQSLRAHMHHNPQAMVDMSTLGRSVSMRTPGELSYSRQHQPPPPPPPFSLATPPRNKSHLPHYAPSDDGDVPGADLQRHHSLGRSQALLSLDQREDLRRRLAASPSAASATSAGTPTEGAGHSRRISEIDQAGLGRSLWTPGAPAPGEDGWSSSASTAQQLQDALDALSIRDGGQMHRPAPTMGEEPSWVTNLVGVPGQPSPTSQVRPLGWDDRNSPYTSLGQWGGGPSLQPPPLLYQQQQQLYAQTQAQLKLQAAGIGGGLPLHGLPPMHLQQGYMGGNYMGAPFNTGYGAQPGPMHGVGGLLLGHGMSGGPPMSAHDVDVMELARSKGLNPATFDCRPPYARFFVIKSYTEDDVQKSLKHEVWSSTVLGNKRLDNAWRESHDKGPIYLFFSVNSSRNFCGVAEMISGVDESKTSDIWATDKWKGLMNVRWRFVRDVPTSALRHLRLTNTPDRKPITTSRDTQELPYDIGCEVLQIFLDHQHKSKTSLLQDFAYYERLSASRSTGTATPTQGPPGPGGPGGPGVHHGHGGMYGGPGGYASPHMR
ncbi:hypothetical protein CspeluHIS016_0102840 [Cutaneotrichosporon spelunceum]|uniref:YTH domain-containing protein n=1 Tax=Cutaneotrichosporon spelunceum TaxID=1672016 RepID=A0AAD3TME3_9TREE|nr:hypothetical protein CspeluHIS016_0102840 [Cutaneotrichosporon spelunceum]